MSEIAYNFWHDFAERFRVILLVVSFVEFTVLKVSFFMQNEHVTT
jgi:hypothetical protein